MIEVNEILTIESTIWEDFRVFQQNVHLFFSCMAVILKLIQQDVWILLKHFNLSRFPWDLPSEKQEQIRTLTEGVHVRLKIGEPSKSQILMKLGWFNPSMG